MPSSEFELESIRTRLADFDDAVQAEIRTIIEEAVLRSMAVVRRAEQSAARLSYLKFLENEGLGGAADSQRDSVKTSTSPAMPAVKKASSASPKRGEATKSDDGELTIDANGIPRRNGKLDLKAALEGVDLPDSPQSARHVMLSILKQKGEPVPFPILDHAVIAQDMTRSAGEKSRRTMEQTGLVRRIGKKLAITDLGEEALAAFESNVGSPAQSLPSTTAS